MRKTNRVNSLITQADPLKSGESDAVFPLPVHHDRRPVVLLFDRTSPNVAIAYEKDPAPGGELVRCVPRETDRYCIPQPTPVLAVATGWVIDVFEQSPRNNFILLDHGSDYFSFYGGIERPLVRASKDRQREPPRVVAGEPIGTLATSRAGPLRPLFFEIWRVRRRRASAPIDLVDPIRHLRRRRHLRCDDHVQHTPAQHTH